MSFSSAYSYLKLGSCDAWFHLRISFYVWLVGNCCFNLCMGNHYALLLLFLISLGINFRECSIFCAPLMILHAEHNSVFEISVAYTVRLLRKLQLWILIIHCFKCTNLIVFHYVNFRSHTKQNDFALICMYTL